MADHTEEDRRLARDLYILHTAPEADPIGPMVEVIAAARAPERAATREITLIVTAENA